MTIHEDIKKAVSDAIEAQGWPAVDFAIEHPADVAHGDYACNAAMVLAKKVGKAPRVVAEQLCAALEGIMPAVKAVSVAGPGFLNFHLSRDFFAHTITEVNEAGDAWGRNDSWKGKTVLVEYTDPNPFKEFHIGHLFTNTVGESLARLFIMNGANTKRVNYQGDVGLHVASAIFGMMHYGVGTEKTITAKDLGSAYVYGATEYKKDDPDVVYKIREINKKIYSREDENINALYDAGREASLRYFESIYDLLDTKFDEYFFESEAGPKGKELVLTNPDIFPESDGARIFDGESHGLHTRVFLNKEGLPTYEAKELALAKMKEDRFGVYDLSIVSTSNEITEYFKVLKMAMSLVYPDLAAKTEHIGHGTVRLSTGKMSSRTGDVIRALDFIDSVSIVAATKMNEGGRVRDIASVDELARDVAIAAIKYATLRGSILQNSTFDHEKALSFEGDSGPYLQYTYARITSVLEKAATLGMKADVAVVPETVYQVERYLYRFPEVVKEALAERAPHKVVSYLTELAGAFNSFYAAEKMTDKDDLTSSYKLALAVAVKGTLKNGLWTLGIKAPEKM